MKVRNMSINHLCLLIDTEDRESKNKIVAFIEKEFPQADIELKE